MHGLRFLAVLVFLTAGVQAEPMTRDELAGRMEAQTRALSAAGVSYKGRWTPPGGSESMVMDCSNTTRWLYADATGYQLPRTASAQYEALRAKGRVWKVKAESRSWWKRLKPGDLLFWENTYRPQRKPPITHVMVYLGPNADGTLRMAGAQGSRGVDVYTFRPAVPYGGYRWFLWFKRTGKFTAFGRPL